MWLKGEECVALSRHGSSWLILKLATNETLIVSDPELLNLYGSGQLKWRSRPIIARRLPHFKAQANSPWGMARSMPRNAWTSVSPVR